MLILGCLMARPATWLTSIALSLWAALMRMPGSTMHIEARQSA